MAKVVCYIALNPVSRYIEEGIITAAVVFRLNSNLIYNRFLHAYGSKKRIYVNK